MPVVVSQELPTKQFKLDYELARIVLPKVKTTNGEPEIIFSELQVEIIEWIAAGASYQIVADKVNISLQILQKQIDIIFFALQNREEKKLSQGK